MSADDESRQDTALAQGEPLDFRDLPPVYVPRTDDDPCKNPTKTYLAKLRAVRGEQEYLEICARYGWTP